MNPLHTRKNQYRGINAHLHSLYQAEEGWSSFHAQHIVHLANLMTQQLAGTGYSADVEESLQIRRMGETDYQPRADLMIRDRERRSFKAAPLENSIALADLFAEDEIDDHPYFAVVIRPQGKMKADPVAWVELLSPTNKKNRADIRQYADKRRQLLESGLVFVELDYLHETPSTFGTLSYYATSEDFPAYHIVVLDPRPSFDEGQAWHIPIYVDEHFAPVTIPLNAGDQFVFDFESAYQFTFEMRTSGDDVDYVELPLHFGRYSHADQRRILLRMIAVLEAAASGRDLDAVPLPLEHGDWTLDAAMAHFRALTQAVP
jgi:hypothetical protein